MCVMHLTADSPVPGAGRTDPRKRTPMKHPFARAAAVGTVLTFALTACGGGGTTGGGGDGEELQPLTIGVIPIAPSAPVQLAHEGDHRQDVPQPRRRRHQDLHGASSAPEHALTPWACRRPSRP